eukprot:TRINITY_DN5879_c0_g1_i5.p1 TRINITY_DN5879_c0_g1~~TRINITY_DN5879_c0_g1_i5.p1  ORF type:complete len:391 (+),score=44.11 TRINITY_DN5879_c0_g1_i5:352-1524(+)
MALVRFVNGVLDPSLGDGTSTYRILSTAFALPVNMIDLRHAGTHGELPSLEILTETCKEGLNWLYANYWAKQQSQITEKLESLRTSVPTLLREYRALMKKRFETNDAEHNRSKIENAIEAVNSQMHGDLVSSVLVTILLDDYILIPKSKENKVYRELPERFQKMWEPALQKISNKFPSLLPSLLHSIATKLISGSDAKELRDSFRANLLLCWFKHLVVLSQRWNISVTFQLKNVAELAQQTQSDWAPKIKSIVNNLDKKLSLGLSLSEQPHPSEIWTSYSSHSEPIGFIRTSDFAFSSATSLNSTNLDLPSILDSFKGAVLVSGTSEVKEVSTTKRPGSSQHQQRISATLSGLRKSRRPKRNRKNPLLQKQTRRHKKITNQGGCYLLRRL